MGEGEAQREAWVRVSRRAALLLLSFLLLVQGPWKGGFTPPPHSPPSPLTPLTHSHTHTHTHIHTQFTHIHTHTTHPHTYTNLTHPIWTRVSAPAPAPPLLQVRPISPLLTHASLWATPSPKHASPWPHPHSPGDRFPPNRGAQGRALHAHGSGPCPGGRYVHH